MRIARFGWAFGLLVAAVTLMAPATGRAQNAGNYPEKPVRIIVPFAPAGPTDVVARLIAQKLSERLGKQFYIDNVVGAGGNNGMGQAARAAGGRLHDPVRVLELRRQSEPLLQDSLRPLQRLRAGHRRR